MPSVRLTPRARADLESIWLYTRRKWSEAQADEYYSILVDTFATLLLNDQSGIPVDVRPGYRKLLSGSHVVYFRRITDGVEIVRILHQAMDVRRHL